MNEKRSFWLTPLLAGVAALAALVATVVVIPNMVKPDPAPSFQVGKPVDADATFKIEGDAKVEIMNETSDRYLRSVHTEGDTTEITVVWNKDGVAAAGPADRYVIVRGKMQYFARTYDGNRGLHYDVTYRDGVYIATLNKFRPDGTVEEHYKYDADGRRTLVKMDIGGRKVSETIIEANGDETVTEYIAGAEPKVTFVKGQATSQEFGVVTFLDGTKVPVLKVDLVGDRIVSWVWTKNNGKTKLIGRFEADGKLVVETWNDGKRRLVETYRTQIEDWNRSFYRLESSVAYFAAEPHALDRAFYLRPNGTVERIEDGSNGNGLNWVKFFDEKGKLKVHRTYNKSEPNGYKDEDKSGSEEVGTVDANYRNTSHAQAEVFRTNGEPFIGEPSLKGKIEAFFVEPGKNIGPAETPPISFPNGGWGGMGSMGGP